MELLYIHIVNNNKFKNQDLNFGGKYRFFYNIETKHLEIEENILHIDDFFDLHYNSFSKVSNVTSIIGENGTGKTSLLKLIAENFPSGSNLKTPVIFALKKESGIVIYHTEDVLIQKHNAQEFGFKLQIIKERKDSLSNGTPISFGYDFGGITQTSFIYFSNIFDGTGGYNVEDLYDISTNNLIFRDYIRNIEFKQIDPSTDKKQIETHLMEDIGRQITFINKFENEDVIPFDLPEQIYITFRNDYLVREPNFSNVPSRINHLISSYVQIFSFTLGSFKKPIEQNKYRFIANTFLNFIVDLESTYQKLSEYLKINEVFKLEKKKITIDDLKTILKAIQSHLTIFIKDDTILHATNNLILIIEYIEEVNNDNTNIFFGPDYAQFDTNFDNIANFNLFVKLYLDSYFFRPYLNFNWRNLSSGEKAFLNIFSRFYSLSNDEQKGSELKENVIVLIDEGDIYLHPAWQKQFLKILLEYLPIIFNKTKNRRSRNIQLIFTTNSPIPASDLLNANTIFLEKIEINKGGFIERKTIAKDSLNDQKETFAANIHTLLSDSFFVKNGLVGDFAATKINTIIHQLSSRKDLSTEQRDNMQKLIHQIGEPVIKHKLMQMYNDRYNLEIHDRLLKIEKKLGLND